MRLTERKTTYTACDKNGNLTKVECIEVKDRDLADKKLYELEDIEDGLGIGINVLWHLISNRKIYVKMPFSKKIIKSIVSDISETWFSALISDLFNEDEKNFKERCFQSIALKYDEYGKTWALTKEELKK